MGRMRFMVRTVSWSDERRENVCVMKWALPELEVVVDEAGDAYASFFEACRLLDDTGGVLLEDDVQLCRLFRERVVETLSLVGTTRLVSFFERPKIDLETALVSGSKFLWMQCLYLPPGLPMQIAGFYDEFRTLRPKRAAGMATDSLIAYALTRLRQRYWRIRPTLVQHLPFPSAIGGRARNRQTPYFVDDLPGPLVWGMGRR